MQVLAQLDDIERRLSSLQTEVQELRATAARAGAPRSRAPSYPAGGCGSQPARRPAGGRAFASTFVHPA